MNALPTPIATHSNLPRSNTQGPAFQKLLIGPAMVLGESMAGGHYLDVLCLRKQIATGQQCSVLFPDS
jgi:hypothetical protein